MRAVTSNFLLEQGADLERTWRLCGPRPGLVPVDLTGYSGRLTILDPDGGVLLETSTVQGGLALGGGAGTITLCVPAAVSASWNLSRWPQGAVEVGRTALGVRRVALGAIGSYQCEITAPGVGGRTYRVLQGQVALSPEVVK